LDFHDKPAYATACHNQFLSPKSVLIDHLAGSWSGRLMGGLNEFDEGIDASGLLRLTTLDRMTKLIGNVVSPEMATEARQYGIHIGTPVWRVSGSRSRGLLHRLAKWSPIRWLLQGLYNRLFWILTGQSGAWVELEEEKEVGE
jgi:hypothetical protein